MILRLMKIKRITSAVVKIHDVSAKPVAACVIRMRNDNKENLRKKRKAARKKKIPTATVLYFRLWSILCNSCKKRF
jgi:hypothetical protein